MSDEPVVDPNAAPKDVGTEETQPGQEEVVAGTPAHEALLKANPNASTYGPEVNVVLPPEPTPEEEEARLAEEERQRATEQEIHEQDVEDQP